MNSKPTFFTSDWHVGHEKALTYDEAPFTDLEGKHETLIKRYNACVPDKGICYFLGDMGNKTEDMHKVITRLQGTKVLLLGNHDKGMNTMYNVGFDAVMYSATIYIGDHRITMSHCPLLGIKREDTSLFAHNGIIENWHGETREKHRRSALQDEGQFHLHGHTHCRKGKAQSQKILDRQYDVGCMGNNYTPVSLSTIESWVMTYGK